MAAITASPAGRARRPLRLTSPTSFLCAPAPDRPIDTLTAARSHPGDRRSRSSSASSSSTRCGAKRHLPEWPDAGRIRSRAGAADPRASAPAAGSRGAFGFGPGARNARRSPRLVAEAYAGQDRHHRQGARTMRAHPRFPHFSALAMLLGRWRSRRRVAQTQPAPTIPAPRRASRSTSTPPGPVARP